MLGYSNSAATSDHHQSYSYHSPRPGTGTASDNRRRNLRDLDQYQRVHNLDACAASDQPKVRFVI
jgi:hypothetical protein